MIRRVRLMSGLILFAYLVTHFFNHALCIVSLETADAFKHAVYLVITTWPVTTLLLALQRALARAGVEQVLLALADADPDRLALARHLARVEHHWFQRVLQSKDEPRLYVTAADPDLELEPELLASVWYTPARSAPSIPPGWRARSPVKAVLDSLTNPEKLALAGEDVTFIVRGANLDAIATNGALAAEVRRTLGVRTPEEFRALGERFLDEEMHHYPEHYHGSNGRDAYAQALIVDVDLVHDHTDYAPDPGFPLPIVRTIHGPRIAS